MLDVVAAPTYMELIRVKGRLACLAEQGLLFQIVRVYSISVAVVLRLSVVVVFSRVFFFLFNLLTQLKLFLTVMFVRYRPQNLQGYSRYCTVIFSQVVKPGAKGCHWKKKIKNPEVLG